MSNSPKSSPPWLMENSSGMRSSPEEMWFRLKEGTYRIRGRTRLRKTLRWSPIPCIPQWNERKIQIKTTPIKSMSLSATPSSHMNNPARELTPWANPPSMVLVNVSCETLWTRSSGPTRLPWERGKIRRRSFHNMVEDGRRRRRWNWCTILSWIATMTIRRIPIMNSRIEGWSSIVISLLRSYW